MSPLPYVPAPEISKSLATLKYKKGNATTYVPAPEISKSPATPSTRREMLLLEIAGNRHLNYKQKTSLRREESFEIMLIIIKISACGATPKHENNIKLEKKSPAALYTLHPEH